MPIVRRSVPILAILVCIIALGSVTGAQAQRTFRATLDGAQETPPNGTTATGTGTVFLNIAETQIIVSLQFSGLSSAQTAAHIHKGARTVPGPIEIALPNGSFTGQTFPITPAQVIDLKAGLLYFNVHSGTFPGGE